jgi:hypothetical protein
MSTITQADLMERQAGSMLEAGRNGLQEIVRKACSSRRIRCYHTWSSQKSLPGFPDCVIALPGGPIFSELKRQKARPSLDQVWWLDYFADRGHRCYLWRPMHWLNGTIEAVLSEFPDRGAIDGRWVAGRGVIGDEWSMSIGSAGRVKR